MQTVPGLVLCEKSEGTLIVFQQDAAGAQDIAHGGVIQIQLQQGADALQPVHQCIAVDEKLPGRGMEVLLLQQVDAQGVQQGGAVGLVVLLQAGHRFMNEGTWVQGKSMNVMHQTGNVAWSIFDADYGKYNRMSLENGTGGDMEVTVTITDGKISDIVVNSHAESSDIGAPALDKLIQNAIAANSAEIDGASGATMTSDGFREAVAQALAKAQ